MALHCYKKRSDDRNHIRQRRIRTANLSRDLLERRQQGDQLLQQVPLVLGQRRGEIVIAGVVHYGLLLFNHPLRHIIGAIPPRLYVLSHKHTA